MENIKELQVLPSWDLTKIYNGDKTQDLLQDKEKLTKLCNNFYNNYYNKIHNLTAEQLYNCIAEYEKISIISSKLSCYAYLRYSENVQDLNTVAFYQQITEFLNELNSKVIFFTLSLNKIDTKKLQEYYSQSENLLKYKPYITDLQVFKDFQLQEELEQLFIDKDLTSNNAFIRLYDEQIASLRFNINGEKCDITKALNFMMNPSAEIRKTAGKEITKVFNNNKSIFIFVINNIIKDKQTEDKWRKFKQPISSRNLENFVEDEIVENLILSTKNNYKNTSHKFYEIKAKMLGKNQLEWYDRMAPIFVDEESISWEKAKDIVINAYYGFNTQAGDIAKNFFDSNYIDAKIVSGKMQGAYCHPCVSTLHPYILMNYQGQVNDVMTLAHEVGHGIHQVLSSNQGNLMCDASLTLSETASVFGEMLTFKSLMNDNSLVVDQKKILLSSKIESMINTTVRQIAFCDFEIQLHNERKKGELTFEQISDIWLKIQKQSLGDFVNITKDYSVMWFYVSHFIHVPFYVYAYAFGDCLVNSLYSIYDSKQINNFEEKYLELLKAGGTKRHKELLQPFGLSLAEKNFWNNGLNLITDMIKQLEAMI